MPYIEVSDLTKTYRSLFACKELTLTAEKGESIGIVGESGCGKSTFGKMVAGLTNRSKGSIRINGMDIDNFEPNQLAKEAQLVFQHSSLALNPKLTIRQILEEPLLIHKMPTQDRAKRALSLADLSPKLLDRYPGEISGGQRQRINVLRALMLEPKLLILDESFASLDDETKKGLAELLKTLRWKDRLNLIVISHDLELIVDLTDRLFVMYAGQFVESGRTKEIAKEPYHPYTKALFAAEQGKKPQLFGDFETPSLKGCPLARRCPQSTKQCHQEIPTIQKLRTRTLSCHLNNIKGAANPY